MNEHIIAARLLDKSIPLFGIKPFYYPFCQGIALLYKTIFSAAFDITKPFGCQDFYHLKSALFRYLSTFGSNER